MVRRRLLVHRLNLRVMVVHEDLADFIHLRPQVELLACHVPRGILIAFVLDRHVVDVVIRIELQLVVGNLVDLHGLRKVRLYLLVSQQAVIFDILHDVLVDLVAVLKEYDLIHTIIGSCFHALGLNYVADDQSFRHFVVHALLSVLQDRLTELNVERVALNQQRF